MSGFRTDIQGLRAIAVLVVVLSHLGVAGFSGGFVGVDVFFVISGFLITQLLIREMDTNGHVSLIGFYIRRARRILPAATVVLIATGLASALWLGPVRTPAALTDTLWAAVFAVNFHLAWAGTDYFAQGLPPSPVQHYWSLAVEEQFYLVWPLLLLLFTKLPRGSRSRLPWGTLGALTSAIVVISFWWSVHQTVTLPTFAYFSSFTRAWELAVGCHGALLIHLRSSWIHQLARRGMREIVAFLGLGAIAWSCVTFDAATPFPSWRAALPVLGSFLLLIVGATADSGYRVGRALSIRPMRIIGDWSYSLYLWHWPVIVIVAQYLGAEFSWRAKLAALAGALMLSGLSYRFIETPLRKPGSRRSARMTIAWYPVSVGLIVASFFVSTQVSASVSGGDGRPIALPQDWRTAYQTDDHAEALVRASVAAARRDHPIPATLQPALGALLDSEGDVRDCDYKDDSVRRLCPRGDVDAERTIVLIGNSHGRHWISAFDKIAEDYGYRTFYLVKVQCVGSLVTPDEGTSSEPFEGCADFHEFVLDQVRQLQPDLVVLSTSPTNRGVYDDEGAYYSDRDEVDALVKQGYVNFLRALAPHADRTVLLADVPYLNGDPGTCLSSPRATLQSCVMTERIGHRSSVRDQVAAAEEVGVEAIETSQWFCWKDRCPTVIGGYLPYRDSGHITNEYSAWLAGPLAQRLGLTRSGS